MKLKTTYLMAFVGAALMATSCATEELIDDPAFPADYTIGLDTYVATNEAGTRAANSEVSGYTDEAGEQEMNENLLQTLDFFFYHDGNDETEAACYHLFYNVGVQSSWTKTLAVSKENLLSILNATELAENLQCYIYVVANYYDDASAQTSKFADDATRKFIRSTVLVSDFDQNKKQPSFVMEGNANATLKRVDGRYKLDGTVSLWRIASKTRLSITIDPTALSDGVKDANGNLWYPSTGGIKCMLVNGIKRGYISRELSANGENYTYVPNADDYFPQSMADKEAELVTYGRDMRTEGNSGGQTWYKHDYPFYSYRTVDWKDQQDREAYILLMMPWTNTVGSTTKTAYTYYQLPMPIKSTEDEYRLRSYRYYRIEATIGSMGSFSIEDPVEIKDNSYIIVNWGTVGTGFPADLEPVKYLAVYETNITLDDVDTKEIQFASSDDILVVEGTVSMRQRDLANSTSYLTENWTTFNLTRQTPTTEDDVTTTVWRADNSGNPITIVIDNATGVITFKHELKNEIAKTGDFTEYEISFTIAHGGTDATYREKINITQYPMLPVKRELNADYISTTNKSSHLGYIFINGYQNSNTQATRHTGYNIEDYGGVHGELNSNNQNPNRYIVSVSSLSSDKYVIGDPRLKYVNNALTGNAITTASTGEEDWTAYARTGRYNNYTYYYNSSEKI